MSHEHTTTRTAAQESQTIAARAGTRERSMNTRLLRAGSGVCAHAAAPVRLHMHLQGGEAGARSCPCQAPGARAQEPTHSAVQGQAHAFPVSAIACARAVFKPVGQVSVPALLWPKPLTLSCCRPFEPHSRHLTGTWCAQ